MEPRAATLVLALLICGDGCASEYVSSGLSAHLDTMLAEYDREEPPAASVLLSVELDVRHATINDARSSMRLLADLKMSWMDPRLSWNESQWEGNSLLVSAERLWLPDVYAESLGWRAAGGDVLARLSAAGAVSRLLRLDLTEPFQLELNDWPLDKQLVYFSVSSREHDIDELDLEIVEYKNSVVVETGAWEVISVSGSRLERVSDAGGRRRVARWAVAARRRGEALAAQHGAVLAAATLLLAAALARPYTQRMPLAATATLVTALWLISVMSVIPGGGASTPRVVRVMHALCVVCAASGAAAALAQRVSRATAAPPHALRSLLSNVSHVYTITPSPESLSESRSGAWAAAATLLDALLALLAALAVIVLVAIHLLA